MAAVPPWRTHRLRNVPPAISMCRVTVCAHCALKQRFCTTVCAKNDLEVVATAFVSSHDIEEVRHSARLGGESSSTMSMVYKVRFRVLVASSL